MRIGIIGSGKRSRALTHCLRALGHDVGVANSRGPASLGSLANETGARAAAPDGRDCQTSFTQRLFMFDRREFLGGAVLAASLAPAAAIAGAQTPPTPIANTAQRLNAFGPEADRLARRAGLWDVVETLWDRPEGELVTTRGLVAERAMFGSMLQEILRPPADIGRRAVARTDMLAYNRMEGRWGYVSFDTRAPVGLMPAWSNDVGAVDAIALVFAPFAVPAPGGAAIGQLLRMEQVIRFSDDTHDVKDQYFTLADGSGTRWLAHRYAYQRRAA